MKLAGWNYANKFIKEKEKETVYDIEEVQEMKYL
jgi:hypothetical protein